MNHTEENLREPNVPMFVTSDLTQIGGEVMEQKSYEPEGLIPDLDLSRHTKKNWPSSKNVSQ